MRLRWGNGKGNVERGRGEWKGESREKEEKWKGGSRNGKKEKGEEEDA